MRYRALSIKDCHQNESSDIMLLSSMKKTILAHQYKEFLTCLPKRSLSRPMQPFSLLPCLFPLIILIDPIPF